MCNGMLHLHQGTLISGYQPSCHLWPRRTRTLRIVMMSGPGMEPRSLSFALQTTTSPSFRNLTCYASTQAQETAVSIETFELADIDWEDIRFGLILTDYIYVMKCDGNGNFTKGQLQRFGNIDMSPSAAGKGSLYIRPLLMGSGAVLGLAPTPKYTFLIYVPPVGNYFKEGVAPIHCTGGVKTIGNYATVLKAQTAAKVRGYSDVLYLDCAEKKYLEEVSSCNIFVVKGNVMSTPAIKGTILPGITRKSIIEVALNEGYQVEERLVVVDELLDADEVFCTGTSGVVSTVESVTYRGKRVTYVEDGFGVMAQRLYSALTGLQMGLSEDKMKWTVELRRVKSLLASHNYYHVLVLS